MRGRYRQTFRRRLLGHCLSLVKIFFPQNIGHLFLRMASKSATVIVMIDDLCLNKEKREIADSNMRDRGFRIVSF